MKKISLLLCLVLLVTAFSGCSIGKSSKNDLPTVKWYLLVGKVTKSNDTVNQAVKEKAKEKLDVKSAEEIYELVVNMLKKCK